jgi:amylosucrase
MDLEKADAVGFLARLEAQRPDIEAPLKALYGNDVDVDQLVRIALKAAADRPVELRELDRRREITPDWYQRESAIGYVCYVDRFSGTIPGIGPKLDYLEELGVTYLHLMPLLKPREGENDGGYAVADYRAVDPRLGTMDDLEALAGQLRARGMSLCIDLVLNHTAKEHAWAQGWASGDPAYEDFYFAFPDRELPDAYERTITPVFPDRAPGSFTKVNNRWVWTSFWSYQWDLNYANPAVFAAMLETILWLANRGIEIFRMDAVPFMWKRLGTSCLNQPEVHRLVQALHALVKLAAPAVIFKAEAIVAPEDLVQYLGAHDRYQPECELAYHNQLMVMLWSSLATKDARLMAVALRRMRDIPAATSWVTYVRCHDDIGWAVSDADAAAVGWDGWHHKQFLNEFYSGRRPLSYARGALFQENVQTGDARISGSAAALCGLEDALQRGDDVAVDYAIRRLLLLYAIAFGFGGIPLIYMGDELGLRNDHGYAADPARADDNRWLHRPPMDWAAAARRCDPATVEGRIFGALRSLAALRSQTISLRTGGAQHIVAVDNDAVFAWRRRHPRSGHFVGLANFAETPQSIDVAALSGYGWLETVASSDGPLDVHDGRAHLPALSYVWLAQQ